MTDSSAYRCPNCDSTDLNSIRSKAIDGELLEYRSCVGLFQVVYDADRVTKRLHAV